MAPACRRQGLSTHCHGSVCAGGNFARHAKIRVSMSQRATYPPHYCSIDQDLSSSWLQDCSLQRCDYVPHMEIDNILQLVGCAVQQAG